MRPSIRRQGHRGTILLALSLLLPFGVEATEIRYRVEGRLVRFEDVPKLSLTISSDCKKKNSAGYACAAYGALARASMLDVAHEELAAGALPGAAVCHSLGARVVTGTLPDGGENLFCKFKDRSLVDTGTLDFYARENDEKRSRKTH